MKNLTKEEAWNKITAYCAASERCKQETIEKLKHWEVDTTVINQIIPKLEEENYLNEERYCKSFVHDKFYFNKWGKKKIAQALYAKRISSAVAWKHLDTINQEDYLDVLQHLLESKKKSIKAKNEYELKGKLIRFALGRGFEMEDISKCITLSE